MPYLPDPTHRARLISGEDLPECAGDINFLIADMVDGFLTRKGLTYANLNECVGAVECAKLEIYRRIAAPYEDVKIVENGDAFTVTRSIPPYPWKGNAEATNRIIERL